MPYRNGKIVNWKVKVKGIKELLNTNESNEEAKRVGKEIYKIITSERYYKYFEDFDRLDDFDVYVETVEELNDLLNDMYDYCDGELIWIDLK